MHIAIHSEMDSRVLLYPLMQILYHYGSIAVISNNKYVKRLIEGEYTGTINNISIFYDEDATADELCEELGIARDDYDFVIYDNSAESYADLYLIPIGSEMTESFSMQIDGIRDNDNVTVIEFGTKKGKKAQPKKEPKEKKPAAKKKKKTPEELEAEKAAKEEAKWASYDPSKKFDDQRESREERLSKQRATVTVPMPSFDMIESFEGDHTFVEPPTQLVSIMYEKLKDTLGVDRRNFEKGVRRVESRNYIK